MQVNKVLDSYVYTVGNVMGQVLSLRAKPL